MGTVLLTGADGSPAELALLRADGTRATVKAVRKRYWEPRPATAPSYRIIAPGIGYADLGKLTNEEVDAMFAAFADTRAIVFDMRGYPNGTAWSIAPRLNRHADPTVAARFERCRVGPGALDFPQVPRETFLQSIPPRGDAPQYRGRTVMLIDERAASQAEHTGLFFEAATGTTFIGSNTAGANGDITSFVLPGSVRGIFGGHDVRHADGRQLQRIGLQPHVRVEPTVAGIRAGKDEVLDAALAWLTSHRE
jgi:C-terminal processing protease CtpA/Prc